MNEKIYYVGFERVKAMQWTYTYDHIHSVDGGNTHEILAFTGGEFDTFDPDPETGRGTEIFIYLLDEWDGEVLPGQWVIKQADSKFSAVAEEPVHVIREEWGNDFGTVVNPIASQQRARDLGYPVVRRFHLSNGWTSPWETA